MSTYISLVKLTEKGLANFKEAPQRLKEAEEAFKKAGGRLKEMYLCFGEYDYVVVVEAPSDEAAVTLLLKIGGRGNVRTSTFRAFTRSEFEKIAAAV